MILMKWVEKTAKALIVPSTNREIVLSASGPLVVVGMLEKVFDPKDHDVALLLRFSDSKFVLIIEGPGDVPMYDIMDPSTGKWLLKYDMKDPGEKRFLRLE